LSRSFAFLLSLVQVWDGGKSNHIAPSIEKRRGAVPLKQNANLPGIAGVR
jgi:hypothetical protein